MSEIKVDSLDPDDSTERTCERCDDSYESYLVFVRDSFPEIVSHLRCDWNHLCKPCRMAVTDYGAYLTESEIEELEPKTVDMIEGEVEEK